MTRTRTGKRIALTERDIEIFRVLARYRYLSSAYIYAFVGGASETRFKERLGDLFHEGYIDRPERQWEMAECRHRPVIHEIGAGARRVLAKQGIIEEPRTWLRAASDRQFQHSSMICEVMASIEIGVRQRPGLRFISWPEILAKAPIQTRSSAAPFRLRTGAAMPVIVPDGLFGLEYEVKNAKTYRFFAVEADRGTMPVVRSDSSQTSCVGKLTAYRELLMTKGYKEHLGIPNLLVLMVTTQSHRLDEILERFEDKEGRGEPFLFKAIEPSELVSPTTKLLFDSWRRTSLPPLFIDH